MNFQAQIKQLLEDIGPGRMLSSAYDTAWIARLVDWDESISRQALNWLREHQLPDGSWGASQFSYFHDRLICTLAAMTALGRWGDERDQNRLRRARLGMDIATKGLRADTVGETVGFEMIAPTLMGEAKKLGVIRRDANGGMKKLIFPVEYDSTQSGGVDEPHRRQDDILELLGYRRIAKMKRLPKGKISRYVTVAFSAEMVGNDGVHLLDVENLQEGNGSVGHSPSATAHFVLNVQSGNTDAIAYLRQTVLENEDGGAPDVAPFDVFERGWSLWNLALIGSLDEETLSLCQPHLDFLEQGWQPGIGVGFAAEYSPKDGDDSGLTFEVLARYGRKMDIEALLGYEKAEHFRCYALESNPSISANIHILGALRQAGFDAQQPAIRKIVNFLYQTRFLQMFWFDKWHSSPYYPTVHAIIAAERLADDLIENAVAWILETQNLDGSWGYYIPTAEETAYCLQALLIWKRGGKTVPEDKIKRGLDWLHNHMDPPYPPLWIGKSLYSPGLVVRSAILSALSMGLQE
jgi:halimadienyl-diphosphate synthase